MSRVTYGFWEGELEKTQRKGLVCRFHWKTGDLPLHLMQTRWQKFVRVSLHRTQLKTLIARRFVCFKNGRNREMVIGALQISWNVILLKSLTTGFTVLSLNAGELVDGQPYPSSVLYQLLAGLLRFSGSKSEDCPNFLDKKDSRFQDLRCCTYYDILFSSLSQL